MKESSPLLLHAALILRSSLAKEELMTLSLYNCFTIIQISKMKKVIGFSDAWTSDEGVDTTYKQVGAQKSL